MRAVLFLIGTTLFLTGLLADPADASDAPTSNRATSGPGEEHRGDKNGDRALDAFRQFLDEAEKAQKPVPDSHENETKYEESATELRPRYRRPPRIGDLPPDFTREWPKLPASVASAPVKMEPLKVEPAILQATFLEPAENPAPQTLRTNSVETLETEEWDANVPIMIPRNVPMPPDSRPLPVVGGFPNLMESQGLNDRGELSEAVDHEIFVETAGSFVQVPTAYAPIAHATDGNIVPSPCGPNACAPSCDASWGTRYSPNRYASTCRRLFGTPGCIEDPNLCPNCGLLGCRRKSCGRFYIDGWITQGVTLNFDWPEGDVNGLWRFNDVANEYDLNQIYLRFGRRMEKRPGRWDWGARVDLLYGSDYLYTSSVGLETHRFRSIYDDPGAAEYDPARASLRWNSDSGPRRGGTAAMYGLSMPQMYAELFVPLGWGTTIRAGHFYADMGLESAMAPKNFFSTHSYSFMYGMPTTFTGMTVEQQFTRRLALVFGLTQGWDIWESPNKSVGWLGGVRWKTFDGRSRISWMLSADRPSSRDDFRANYALTFRHRLTPRWEYALEHTLGYEENGHSIDSLAGTRDIARWVSVSQSLQWHWTEKLALGLRGEWFRDDGHRRILQRDTDSILGKVNGRDYFGLTLGLNWRPTRYLTVRPEVRYDWSDVSVESEFESFRQKGVFDNGNRGEQLTFGVDMTLRF